MQFVMGYNEDPDVDAIYIKLLDSEYGGGKEVDDKRHINLDKDGNILGIEFLSVSGGVDLDDLHYLPDEVLQEVNRLMHEHGIKINQLA